MKFVTTCIDDKTGYTMMLSEVTYNQAVEWLKDEALKYGRDIFRAEQDGNMIKLSVGKSHIDNDETGNPTHWYTNIVTFYYDESRGYLLQE